MATYAEGDWFAVPLRERGFAAGVVARANPRGVLLGYFFGPRREHIPTIDELDRLTPEAAIWVSRFGDLHLLEEKWPVIGKLAKWDRDAWPTPTFARHEELTGRTYEVVYADDDPNQLLTERLISRDFAQGLPEDGMAGAGFVELRLTNLLG